MLRLIIALLFIAVLSLGLTWIAGEPGRVIIDWADYHIEASLPVILAGVAVVALCCMTVYTLLFALVRTPPAWRRSRLAKRQALGLAALTEAFTAIATQDIATAKKQIVRAGQLMPHQPLTLMFAAQVARMEGNESQAHLYLEQMLKAEGTEFIALRGLIENARHAHNDNAALKYAEKALTIKPQDNWLITTLVGLYTQEGQTQKALRLLESSARRRYISRQDLHQLSAYALYENALTLTEQQRWDFAIAVLEDVLRKQSDFIPASALLAKAYVRQGEIKRALKVIAGAWKTQPHPALTESLLCCYDANRDQRKVILTAEKLAKLHPEHRESHFAMAALAMKREDFPSARGHLSHLLQDRETIRACRAMAELENAGDDHEQATHWLKRASTALPDPGWVCGTCQHTTDTWHITCGHCASVASLVWK